MAEKLTPQQLQAVTNRGGKLLVSAAAGSGKTKVLVDRLMGYLTDPVKPANLDDFLIITYTKAAASELRGKIAKKLSERIAAEPGNRHLQQQMQRLYLAKISTVHAFCTDILREYAYMTDIGSDFRVAEENECLEMQMQVLQQLLDHAYETADEDPDFCALIDSQGLGRDDRQIPDVVRKVYNSARCHLDPDGWMEWCLAVHNVKGAEDAGETVWGQYLISDLHQYLDLQIAAIKKCIALVQDAEGFEKPVLLLSDTVCQLERLRQCEKWDSIIGNKDIDYGRLSFSKKCDDPVLIQQIKAVREACKKGLGKKLRKFSETSEQILSDMNRISAAARGLIALTRQFSAEYDKLKRSRRILDFSDLEQKTLDLLMGRKRSGPTSVAREVSERFCEVMVDEYQDSNAVQDAIFTAITHRQNNCFMVGDVKQSIYQFRLADPGIFLEKYNTYCDAASAKEGQGRKVLLSSNFRSGAAVVDAVNDVFTVCMSESVGGLTYGTDEALTEGIPHIRIDEPEIEFYAVGVEEETYPEEARYVAERIGQLLDGTHMVRQGDDLRPIRPEDIVILLRSPGSVGGEFSTALEEHGIRCNTGTGMNLLDSEEIETFISILQVIDNPMQDIALIAALSSRVFGFTADELSQIRSGHKNASMYEAVCASDLHKAKSFLSVLEQLRIDARMYDLSKLLQSVMIQTRIDSIYASMTDGIRRTENIQAFCQMASRCETGGVKGLSAFLEYLSVMDENGIPISAEQTNAGAVTIMSIHKSKGLEFPVVFLCGLSRDFNMESARAQLLCHKELGIGLSCVDERNRVRYPSLAKRAISEKISRESVSEEMRVLYVAMTRAKDRLIMTYAARNLESVISDMTARMDICDPMLMTSDVDCPGRWVLLAALQRREATELFEYGHTPASVALRDDPWLIRVVKAPKHSDHDPINEAEVKTLSDGVREKLKRSLSFHYPYLPATTIPSKQTATQLKGRYMDMEAAQDAKPQHVSYKWRKPSFVSTELSPIAYGNALHAVMQYINYEVCGELSGVVAEIERLVERRFISREQGQAVDPQKIFKFFSTPLGKKLATGCNALREFKFSVLVDAEELGAVITGEHVLLQGVVDCAIIEPDGITVIDFKTDHVNKDTVSDAIDRYRPQILAYANALQRIYDLPVKEKCLYFFALDDFMPV